MRDCQREVTFVICGTFDRGLWLGIMAEQIRCPLCKHNSIAPIMRDVQFWATVGDVSRLLTCFVGFRCFAGHVFFVMSSEADIENEGKGASMFV